jgi:hypothetical protein
VLPAKISCGRVKEEILRLPHFSAEELEEALQSEDEVERAIFVYSFLAHAYLNGDKGSTLVLLRN